MSETKKNIRVRLYKQHDDGRYYYDSTHMLEDNTTYATLHECIPGLETNDIVLAFDWYLKREVSPHTAEEKWKILKPQCDTVRGLYTQAVQAERASVC